MNTRACTFELSVEGRQIEETVASIFHTLLFHRTLGKFHYREEGSYSVGTLGMVDVDCDFIDCTYVRVASDELNAHIRQDVCRFRDTLRLGAENAHSAPRHAPTGTGQISLEFYQKKRARWPFHPECIPWEIWTVKLDLLTLANEHERQVMRERCSEEVGEKILYICESMNRPEYTPKMPNQSDLELVFDTSYPTVQPYLFKVTYQTSTPTTPSVGVTMKKLIRDTLAI